ncbi:hypothetical protein H4219_001379 [Mycoemilia scoparia]|uniref:Major facilitator superfamily (MFS) profile domain-containing protein n=1 Tax=Mycoemilia scoparia TaxID=417184 RepID=A0A9W8A195_9FUNG|nr:hypothetical protein H4219_001379 [Mycoemilia scoparia]
MFDFSLSSTMNKASSQTPEPGNPLSPGSIDQQLIDDFDKPVSTSRRTIPTVIREYFSSYIWKVDANILPLFIVLYIFSVMDRNNIGNAKVAGLDKDLGLHGEQFNWVVSSMFFTYIFCEIPANIMLKKVHPRVWFPIIIIAWGGVCMCLAAGKSYASLIILRLILGAFEGKYSERLSPDNN